MRVGSKKYLIPLTPFERKKKKSVNTKKLFLIILISLSFLNNFLDCCTVKQDFLKHTGHVTQLGRHRRNNSLLFELKAKTSHA